MLENKSVATVIILTIVTCGIYGWVWLYKTADSLENQGQTGGMGAGVILVLSILLGSIGFLLFGMYADQNLNAIKARIGYPTADNKVIYMILGFIFPIILIGMVQNEINKITPAA